MKNFRLFLAMSGFLFCVTSVFSDVSSKQEALIHSAKGVLEDMTLAPDKERVFRLFENAVAIGIFPEMKKGGWIIGGMKGKGVVLHKKINEQWSTPAFFKIHGGSLGLQIGIQEIDLILFFMTEESFQNFMNNYVNVGINVTASAGPFGRDFSYSPKDCRMKPSEAIYAYSRCKGLFAGIAASGLKISFDSKSNNSYYGDEYTPMMIFEGNLVTQYPDSARKLMEGINRLHQGT